MHTDVLVVGAGVAGLTAAQRAAAAAACACCWPSRTCVLGGGTLLDAALERLARGRLRARSPRCRRCAASPRTTVLGAYGHGVFGALETLASGRRRPRSAGCASGCA